MLSRSLMMSKIAPNTLPGILQYVGGTYRTWNGSTGIQNTVPLNNLIGGIDVAARVNDFVIASYATGSIASRTLTVLSTGYTTLSSLYSNATTVDSNLIVAYKRLTTEETSITFGPTGAAADGGAVIIHVWRGVNSTTPFDVTTTTATGIATGQADPPAITPVTSGAIILVIGAGGSASSAEFTASYLSGFVTVAGTDTYRPSLGVGFVEWTSGAYNPAQFGGGTSGAGDAWTAVTLALKPAPA